VEKKRNKQTIDKLSQIERQTRDKGPRWKASGLAPRPKPPMLEPFMNLNLKPSMSPNLIYLSFLSMSVVKTPSMLLLAIRIEDLREIQLIKLALTCI